MTVYGCSAWACDRLISESRIEGGNPTALADPEVWSIQFAVCADCKNLYCDRCVHRRYPRLGRSATCWSCGGPLVDGRHRQDATARPSPDVVGHVNRGIRLGEEGQLAAAVAELDQAIALRHAYPRAHFYRGVALRELGRHREAIEAFESAARIDPLHAQALFDKANVLASVGQLDESVTTYDRAITIEPQFTAAMVNKGIRLAQCDRLHEALAVLDQAIQLEEAGQAVATSGYVRHFAYGGKGEVLLFLADYEGAVEALQTAIGSGPDNAPNYCNLARALRALGRHEEAARADHMCRQLGGSSS